MNVVYIVVGGEGGQKEGKVLAYAACPSIHFAKTMAYVPCKYAIWNVHITRQRRSALNLVIQE